MIITFGFYILVRILISITVVEFQRKKKNSFPQTLETLRPKLGHVILPQKEIRGLQLAVSRYPSAHI